MPVTLHRFSAPAPSRAIGLAWRRSSPRKADFDAFGAIMREVGEGEPAFAGLGREGGAVSLPRFSG